jgi:carboxymethylenebutenolidase
VEALMNGQMVQYDEGKGNALAGALTGALAVAHAEARLGYLATPEGGAGPGVLVFHAWWGLNDFFKSVCDRLAGEGYVAFAPDFYGGKVVDTIDEAAQMVETGDRAAMQGALDTAVRFILRQPGVSATEIGVIGFSLGAAYALHLSALRPEAVRAVVLFYGTNIVDFGAAKAAFVGHFAEQDKWEPREGVDALQAALREARRPVDFHFYPGAGHWFFEANRAETYRPAAAQLAWQRTLAFLAEQLGKQDKPRL